MVDNPNELKPKLIELLYQGLTVIASLPEELYTDKRSDETSSIGVQWRHTINFPESFLAGYTKGEVDYFFRNRDRRFEENLGYAFLKSHKIIYCLQELDLEDKPIRVHGELGETTSSTGRELEAIAQHTTHHYSIIALMLRKRDVAFPKYFGYALSTLAAKCVR